LATTIIKVLTTTKKCAILVNRLNDSVNDSAEVKTMAEAGAVRMSIYLDGELVQRIDAIAQEKDRSRSNMARILIKQALDGNGNTPHPRVVELIHAYATDHISYDELVREIGQLTLAQLASAETATPVPTPA
jgi:hypothetical protein